MAKAVKTLPIQVFDEYFLARKVSGEKTTSGGVVLPSTVNDRGRVIHQVEILAVGEGKMLECGERKPLRIVPGDKALVSGQAGLDLGEEIALTLGLSSDQARECWIYRQEDLMGKITNE